MLNYTLNTNNQNEALFIMRAGKDYVYGTMPYARAAKMCEDGKVTRGDDEDYPVAVDGKYFFSGQMVEEAASEDVEPARKPKKRSKK